MVICGCVLSLCGTAFLVATVRRGSVKSPRTWECLICSCVATRGRERAIREGGERGCHVELTGNCTTPQRKITTGTKSCQILLPSSTGPSSFHYTFPVGFSDISENPFRSHSDLYHVHWASSRIRATCVPLYSVGCVLFA